MFPQPAAVVNCVPIDLYKPGESAGGGVVHGEQSEVQSLARGVALQRRSSARRNTTLRTEFRTQTVVIPSLNQRRQRDGNAAASVLEDRPRKRRTVIT